MNLKKFKIINVCTVFILSFFAHFVYEWFPNIITSIFFPINESIFEHMKIFVTCFLFYGIIEFILFKKFKIEFNNYLFSLFTSSFLGVIFYLAIFIPIYFYIGHSMFISITLMFITYIFMNVISYYILKSKYIPYLENLSIVFIIFLYVAFGFLTYNPPHNFLFLDIVEEKYGIDEPLA